MHNISEQDVLKWNEDAQLAGQSQGIDEWFFKNIWKHIGKDILKEFKLMASEDKDAIADLQAIAKLEDRIREEFHKIKQSGENAKIQLSTLKEDEK